MYQHYPLIKHFESCRLKPYLCSAGVPTIGWGSTFYEDGRKVTVQDPAITQERADSLFKHTVSAFEKGVVRLATRSLKAHEFSALVSFAFNVGLDEDADAIAEGLGDSTLLRLLNTGQPAATVAARFTDWCKVGGKREWGLYRRRLAEAHLFLTGNLKLDWNRTEHGF